MADQRRVVNLRDAGIPEVPVFGRYEYSSPHAGLQTHTHPDTLEICYLNRGRQTYYVGGRYYHLAGGDVFVTFPDEPHNTGRAPQDRSVLYWLNLALPRPGRPMLSLSARDSTLLTGRLLGMAPRHFRGSASLKPLLDEILALYDQLDYSLRRIAIINCLVRYLLEVLECADRHAESPPSQVIARIVAGIELAPEAEYSLRDLAEQAGLSISRFKARFLAEVGVPPHEFVLRSKIEAAKKRLAATEDSITQIAMSLGFSSSQYFATVFKRFTRQKPCEFRRHGPTIRLQRGEKVARPQDV